MMKTTILICLLCTASAIVSAQDDTTTNLQASMLTPKGHERMSEVHDPHYKINLKVDGAIILPCVAWTIYAFPKIYSKPNIDSAIVAGLKKENIPAFDRWAVRHSDKADELSNIAFYASMPYPFFLFLDRDIRKDAGTVSALYLETMGITGLLYTGGDYFVDRYRPETYDETKPFGERQSGNEKNAFFAGHVALVSSSTFFAASIYDQYHPHSTMKWVLYGFAIGATGATIYLRHMAGKHFPSDLLVGTIEGVGCGMLVPRLHRYKPGKKQAWHLMPTVGEGYGLTAVYKF